MNIGAYGNTAEAAKSSSGGLPTLTDYYVNASTGSNTTGDGTQTKPWKTITYSLGNITGTGRTLHIAAGTYNTTLGETFPILMKNGISLIGAGMDVSIIDASSSDMVIKCLSIVDAATRVEGFTVKGGKVTASSSAGAGIFISAGSMLKVANNKITGNINGSVGKGGGLYIENSSPWVVTNTISGNSVGASGDGAGIYITNGSPVIEGNRIISNVAGNANYGGGVFISGSTSAPRIINNLIIKNPEGGIICESYSKPRIINNTICENSGPGIMISSANPDTIMNNIISLNSGYGINESGTTSDPGKVWYNLFYANNSGVYNDEGTTEYYTVSTLNTTVSEAKNNLEGDPLFLDRKNGDYHERAGSLAIDAGNPASSYGSEPAPNGSRVNIGAYGNTAEAAKSIPSDLPNYSDYYVNASGGNNVTGDGSQSRPWQTITFALGQITGTGRMLHVAAGTYDTTLGETFPIVVKNSVSMVGAGKNQSILDASYTNLVLQCIGIVEPLTSIEGFTIKRGTLPLNFSSAAGVVVAAGSKLRITDNEIVENTNQSWGNGGGMYIANSSPAIVNNTISRNSPGTFGNGAGIYIYNSSPLIQNNTITNNKSGYTSYGSGIYVTGATSSPRILNNIITLNVEGGINCEGSSKPRIINNTISDNTTDGIVISSANPDSIINNIISLNSGYGINETNSISDPGKIWYNLFYSNSTGVYRDEGTSDYYTVSTLHASVAECKNNIEGDPMFINKIDGDYRLRIGSPAINTGDPGAPLDSDGSRADIGALYYQTQAPAVSVLSSPSNGATAQPTTLTLSWTASAGATKYHLQVSASSAFTLLVVDDSTLTGISRSVGPLANNTTYYWRVRAGSSAGWSAFSGSWSFTTAAISTLLGEYKSDANTVLLMHMNETSGSTVSDASSYGNNGIATGTTISDGKISKGRSFNGAGDYISVPHSSSLNYLSELTIEGFFRISSAVNYAGITKGTTQWAYSLALMGQRLAFTNGAPGNSGTIMADSIPSNTWIHLAAIISGANVKLYFNGVKSVESTLYYPITNNTEELTIGIDKPGSVEYYKGLIDEVRISNKARSPQEFNLQLPPKNLSVSLAGLAANLSWQNGGGAVGLLRYKIYRGSDSTNVSLIDSTISTSYSNLGLTAGTKYYYRLSAVDSTGFEGAMSYAVSAVPQTGASAPTVSTSAASSITSTSATLNGSVNPNSSSTTAYFEWSTNTSFSPLNTTPVQNIGSGTTASNISASLTSLTPGTTYYYRVFAQNTGGTVRGTTQSFSTIIQAPDVVTLSSPSNGASSQQVSVSLNWNSSARAVSYRIQVSTSQTFTTLIVDDSTLTTTARQVSGLSNGVTYYWRVSAKNAGGTSTWSSTWNFITTIVAPAAPAITAPASGSINQPLNLTLSWTASLTATRYRLQVSTSSTFSPLLVDDTTLTSTSRQIGALSYSTKYYWRVSAGNSGGTSSYSTTADFTTIPTPPATISVSNTFTFPGKSRAGEYTAADFRIIGLPGSTDVPLTDLLPGSKGKDWQVYWDNGASTNYFVEFDGSSIFQFGRGKAFWIVAKSQVTINRSLTYPSFNTSGEAEIALHAGWNLITNPFSTTIPWSRIQSANQTSASIFIFNGSFASSSLFEPYVGYYYFNGSPGTTLSVLKVPYFSLYGSVGKPFENVYEGWKVTMMLSSEQGQRSETWFGVSRSAKNEMDELDVRKPRALGAINDMFFDRPNWDDRYTSFASDIRERIHDLETWDFTVNVEPLKRVVLTFSGVDEIPLPYEVYLLDHANAQSLNLRKDSMYSITTPLKSLQLSILIGTEEKIRGKVKDMLPKEYSLSQNFPNPFNLSTSFNVIMPRPTSVKLMVYNILGRVVRTLFTGDMETGSYWFTWDGRDDRQSRVPTGAYYCRLEIVGERTLMTRMLLIK
ncbi:MAG: DUF1565 domain-containing protein [bacterium]